jgi:hypothetical protein
MLNYFGVKVVGRYTLGAYMGHTARGSGAGAH